MISVDSLTPAIGAELSGIDFNQPVSDTVQDEIYEALLQHSVIIFRNTDVTPADHVRFARMFGQLDDPHPLYPHVEGFDHIVLLENNVDTPPDTNSWHTDLTYKTEQPFASVLVARHVPETGGDTMWSSNYAAYNRLPEGMKQDLQALEVVHDLGDFRNNFALPKGDKSAVQNLRDGVQMMGCNIRPLIGVHPITGRKFLNFNEAFVSHIVGMTTTESNALKQFLAIHMNKPEDQMRWRWRAGDLVMWDNRVTMHYAVADYLPQSRIMNRITVVKDRRELEQVQAA